MINLSPMAEGDAVGDCLEVSVPFIKVLVSRCKMSADEAEACVINVKPNGNPPFVSSHSAKTSLCIHQCLAEATDASHHFS